MKKSEIENDFSAIFTIHPSNFLPPAMPSTKKTQERPLTFELDLELCETLQGLKESGDYKSISEIVRKSIESFDFDTVERCGAEKKQLSTRLPKELRQQLKEVSDEAGVSVGHLVRRCLVQFLKSRSGDYENSPPGPEESPTAIPIEVISYNGKRLINFKQESQPFALDEAQIAAVLAARKELERLMKKSFNSELEANPSGQKQAKNPYPSKTPQDSSAPSAEDPWDSQI